MQSRWLAWAFAATVALSGCDKKSPSTLAAPPKVALGATFDVRAKDKTVKVTVEKVFRVKEAAGSTVIALRVKYDGITDGDALFALALEGPPTLKDASGNEYKELKLDAVDKYEWAQDVIRGGAVSLDKSVMLDVALFEVPTDKASGMEFVLQDRAVTLGKPEEIFGARLPLNQAVDLQSMDTKYKLTLLRVARLPVGFAGHVKADDATAVMVQYRSDYAKRDDANRGFTIVKILTADGEVVREGYNSDAMEIHEALVGMYGTSGLSQTSVDIFRVPSAQLDKSVLLMGGKVFAFAPEAFKYEPLPAGKPEEVELSQTKFKITVLKAFKFPAAMWDPGDGKVAMGVLVRYEFAKESDANMEYSVTRRLVNALGLKADSTFDHPGELSERIRKLTQQTPENLLTPQKFYVYKVDADKMPMTMLEIGEKLFALPEVTDFPAQ